MRDCLQFTVTRNRDDYIRAYRTLCWRSNVLKAYWLLIGLYVGIEAAEQFNSVVVQGADADTWAGTIAVLAIMYVFATWFTHSGWPKFVANAEPEAGISATIRANDEGLCEVNPILFLQADWAFFTGALETRTNFILLRGPCISCMIPKRTLGPDLVGRVRELIRENIPKAKLRGTINGGDAPPRPVSAGCAEASATDSSEHAPQVPDAIQDSVFKLKWNKQDYKNAIRLYYMRNISFIFAFAIVTLFLIFANRAQIIEIINGTNTIRGVINLIPVSTLYIIFVSVFYSLYPALVARAAPDVGTEYLVKANRDGIVVTSAMLFAQLAWRNFRVAVETPDLFMLHIGRGRFTFFPKRFLGGSHEIAQFRDLIRAHVPKTKLLTG